MTFSSNSFTNVSFDKLFEDFDSFFSKAESALAGVQKISRNENESKLTLTIDLPGVARDSLSIEFEDLEGAGHRLVISGLRDEKTVRVTTRVRETIKEDEAEAKLEDGVLTITVPLTEPAEPKVTKVNLS